MLRYGDAGNNEIMIRLALAGATEQGNSLEVAAQQVEAKLRAANLGAFTVISRDIVGPTIGQDLRRKGVQATVSAMALILLYIAFRFRFSFAVGAVVATFHDILVTLAFLTWFGYDLSLNVVAAILTIAGYSVNDTIVIFDRVRENQRLARRESLEKIVNHGGEPDPVAHHHHGRHDVPGCRLALSLWRRGAARVRVHDARRHRYRHLLHGVHRVGGGHSPEQAASPDDGEARQADLAGERVARRARGAGSARGVC